VERLTRFVATLPKTDGARFVPSTANTLAVLEAFNPLTTPTEVSENETVAKLTNSLQKFLGVDAHETAREDREKSQFSVAFGRRSTLFRSVANTRHERSPPAGGWCSNS